MNKILKNVKQRRVSNDKFYTPNELVLDHLNLIKKYIQKDDIIYDPFSGLGAYYNAFPIVFTENTFIFSEIELGKDFFLCDEKVDAIISNPPYSIIDKVLQKSVDLKPHIISYLIGIHNLTNKRIEFMNKNGYKLVFLHFTKVYTWFGMSAIVVFSIEGENCISFDRKVHY